MKTILTPIIDHRNRLQMVSVNGRFIPKYGNHSFYIVMSKSNLLSTNQRMFGQDINVVGRLCRIHTSVNASSIPTNDQLSEVFEFRFNGSLILSETCHHNGNSSTEKRTIFSYAKIKLPLTCNIRSEKINCDSVKFNSTVADTKIVHPSDVSFLSLALYFSIYMANFKSLSESTLKM